MNMQELMHHVRRNRAILATAHDSSIQISLIDPANVNVHISIERYKRQLEAIIEAEAALSKAL